MKGPESGPYELQHLTSNSQCKLESSCEAEFESLFVLIFHHGEIGFLQNCVDRTNPLAIRNGINDSIV